MKILRWFKIINRRQKGRRLELKARKELENLGWLVQIAPLSTRYSKEVDLFGCFDIIALKRKLIFEGFGRKAYAGKKLFIQIKHEQQRGAVKKCKEFRLKYLDPTDEVEVWVWKARKGWKIYEC